MVQTLSERFCIERLESKAQEFVRGCLLCKHVKGPRIIRRPWGPTFTATKRNEGLRWDYLYLGERYGGNAYMLVMKDSLTHYCELFPSGPPNSVISADGLLEWYKRYGGPEFLLSDQSSHYCNQTMDRLCDRLTIERTFSPVYSPWVNGTVERLNKDLLQVIRVMLLEYGFDTTQWPHLLPVVQECLNHKDVDTLGDHAPIERFLGLPKPSALDAIAVPRGSIMELVDVNMEDVGALLENTRNSLFGLHRKVVDKKERNRLQQIAAKRSSVCNFDVGDYVLWSRVDERLPNNKLLSTWLGPFRVVEARSHSFLIYHVLAHTRYEVHSSRLKYYHDDSLGMTEELRGFVSKQGLELAVDEIQGHRFNSDVDRWELSVKWVGLQDVKNSWKGLASMLKSMPARTTQYVRDSVDAELIALLTTEDNPRDGLPILFSDTATHLRYVPIHSSNCCSEASSSKG